MGWGVFSVAEYIPAMQQRPDVAPSATLHMGIGGDIVRFLLHQVLPVALGGRGTHLYPLSLVHTAGSDLKCHSAAPEY